MTDSSETFVQKFNEFVVALQGAEFLDAFTNRESIGLISIRQDLLRKASWDVDNLTSDLSAKYEMYRFTTAVQLSGQLRAFASNNDRLQEVIKTAAHNLDRAGEDLEAIKSAWAFLRENFPDSRIQRECDVARRYPVH